MEDKISGELWKMFLQAAKPGFNRTDVRDMPIFSSFPADKSKTDFIMVVELNDRQFVGIRLRWDNLAETPSDVKSWAGPSKDRIIRLCLNGSERVCLGLATADS